MPKKAPATKAPAPAPTKRLNYSMAVCGRKGTGKSTLLAQMATKYVADNATHNSGQGKRVLILDVNGAPAYAHLPRLSYAQLLAWKPDSTLKMAVYTEMDKNAMLLNVSECFKQGLVIMEDVLTYIPNNPSQKIKQFLVDHRMWDIDVCYTYHTLLYIPPFFFQFLAYIVLLKTNDPLSKLSKSNKIPNMPAVLKAVAELQKESDPYASKLIETGI